MKDLFRNVIYQGKNMFRDKGFVFWSLIYPLIMAVFFYTAFSGMLDIEFKDINIGLAEGNPLEFILETIDGVNIHQVQDKEREEKLDNGEIDGFVDRDLNILVKESGLNQTIIKEIIEQIKQMEKLNRPMENFDFSIDYISNKNQEANSIMVTFYALIAMVSTYGIFPGIETVSLIQANLSNLGTRINLVPLKKSKFLMAGIIVGLSLNLFSNGLLLLFIKYILKIDLFNEIKYSFIFIMLGNLFGVSLGVLIGASNRKSASVKTMMSIAITLFMSFLSGMMGPWMKATIEQFIPAINRFNPIDIVSSNLYRINLLGTSKSLGEGIIVLLSYSIIFSLISYGFLRRRVYDSL